MFECAASAAEDESRSRPLGRPYYRTFDRTIPLTRAQEFLFHSNIPLAKFMAARSGLDHHDALSLAFEGLETSARKYRGNGCKFGTFAAYCIAGLFRQERKKQNARIRGGGIECLRLDSPVYDGAENVLADLLPDIARLPSEQACVHDEIHFLHVLMTNLNDRSRRVISHRYGLFGEKQENLEEVGERMNLSGQRVSQIEIEAIEALRQLWTNLVGPLSRTDLPMREAKAQTRRTVIDLEERRQNGAPDCPRCSRPGSRHGFYRDGRQQYFCHPCKKKFGRRP